MDEMDKQPWTNSHGQATMDKNWTKTALLSINCPWQLVHGCLSISSIVFKGKGFAGVFLVGGLVLVESLFLATRMNQNQG